MKICTITCHDVYNFGASLQAYALQHYLESLGHEVKIIDYKPAYLYKKYDWKAFTSKKFEKLNSIFITRWMFRCAKWCYLRFSLGRKKRFDEFTRMYLHLTPASYHTFSELQRNPPQADVFVAGSDQIWNPLFSNGKDPSYYTDFALPGAKRISYAASFSVNEIPDAYKDFIKALLLKMDAISVREYQGLHILEDMGIDNGVKVLDPIFLIEKTDWIKFMNEYKDNHYILIYDFEGNELLKKSALHFKKKYGLKIYSINDALPRFYADKNFTNVGPEDFIGLIYNCSLFLSNSFHGTAFSIYFNKPFYVFGLTGFSLNSRMDSLLRTLSLENRFIDEDTKLDSLCLACDYEEANQAIKKETILSKQYLSNVIN
ncbi:polysaccharide pyruvyl transferase family protein [Paraprevotella clara]|uniref:polysaccharide pyruvyl transferase family protein n=1 Tax=Paraprevotella clara TaxID=454154 RepID=UPI0039F4B2CB